MNRFLPLAVLLCCAVAVMKPAWAGKAHEHGVARLDVAVEPLRVTFLLEMPLDSLVGFEREPRGDAEKALVDAAVARLKDAAALFRIDPAAGCKPGKVSLESAALGLGAAAAATGTPAAKDAHADIDASFDFDCKDGSKAGFVEVGLFDAFARLQRVDVQTATRRGQMKATLKRPVTRVPLAR
jgi:hypothetical protein